MPALLDPAIGSKLNSSYLINYISSLVNSFDEGILYSFVVIPLFTFLIFIFGIIYLIDKKEKNYNVVRSLIPYILTYIVFFLLTALSVFVMLSYYEASKLASFSRYLAPLNIAFVFFIIYKTTIQIDAKKLQIIYLAIIALVGFSNTTFFITDIKDRRDIGIESQRKQEVFSVVSNNTPEQSKIFIFNQSDDDTIMPLWYARFYLYPRVVNSSSKAITWKIKTDSNAWDLQDWGLTLEDFKQHLIDYNFDYVFLYSTTDELDEKLQSIIDKENYSKEDKLYKVNVTELGDIRLVPIK